MREKQNIPFAEDLVVGGGDIGLQVAVNGQNGEIGLGLVKVPNDAFVILAVVRPIEMHKGRVWRQVCQDEVSHRRVLDGLGHGEGFPGMPTAHGHHGLVPRKAEVKRDRERREISFGVVTEIFEGFQAVLVHVRGVPARHVSSDEGQAMLRSQIQQRLIVCEVIWPKVRRGFEFVLIDPALQVLIDHELVIGLEHLGAERG